MAELRSDIAELKAEVSEIDKLNPPTITMEYLAQLLMETTTSQANSMGEFRHMFSDLRGDVTEVLSEMAELRSDITELKAEVREIHRLLTKQFGEASMKQSAMDKHQNPSDLIHEVESISATVPDLESVKEVPLVLELIHEEGSKTETFAQSEMNMENTGEKGRVRRENNKAVHKTTTTNDKRRLQTSLKRVGVNSIPPIEELNIFMDDVVIHFINPQVQVSLAANTWVVTCTPQTTILNLPLSLYKLCDAIEDLALSRRERVNNSS